MSEKKVNLKRLIKLFPTILDKSKYKQLKIDKESLHLISIKKHSTKINYILMDHLSRLNMDYSKISITDCTGGVGGNTISFGKTFGLVNSIEINKSRFNILKNNINVYDLKNVHVINGDCMEYLNKINNQDVVFFDPPWGGVNYKKYDKLRLSISNISLVEISNMIMDKNKIKCVPKIICFKIPKNYDLLHFYSKSKSKPIYLYDLGKMFIIIILNYSIL